jgi:hypothetical protein
MNEFSYMKVKYINFELRRHVLLVKTQIKQRNFEDQNTTILYIADESNNSHLRLSALTSDLQFVNHKNCREL